MIISCPYRYHHLRHTGRLVAVVTLVFFAFLAINEGSSAELLANEGSEKPHSNSNVLPVRPLLRTSSELKLIPKRTFTTPKPAILQQADPLSLEVESNRNDENASLPGASTFSSSTTRLSQTLPEANASAKPRVIATDEPLKDAIVVGLPLLYSEPTDTKVLASQLISDDFVSGEPIPAPPPQVAPETLQVSPTGDLRNAWLIFQDPALQEMIGRVINENPGLREAQARITQSRASLHRATADLFPQVTANTQYGYRRFSQNGNAFVQDSTATQGFDWYSSGFDTRWEVDLFGRLRSIRSAAGFEALAAEQSYRDVMVTLIGDLMLSYFEYSLAAERIRIAIQNLRVQEEVLKLTEERFRLGEDGQLAVVQARTQVEVTRTTIPALEEQRSVALHRLLLLQGFGAQTMEVPEYWGQRLPSLPPQLPRSIDCELLARRPDVRSSRLLVSAQLERLGASKAEYYPQVFLNGSISLETRDLDAWWDENSVAHSVGPMVSLNLLDFGRIRATVQGEKAKVEQAVARYRQSILEATEEVRNAMVGVERQRERAESLSVAANSARTVVDMAKIEYQEGVTNFQNVLDAQRQVLSVEDQYAVAYGTALVSYARLFKALGGAWYDSVDDPTGPLISD